MKNWLLFAFFLPAAAIAQQHFPSYPTILDSFFNSYGFYSDEPVDGLNFAKKKDGWHVQTIDRITEKVKDDQLFWSAQTGGYLHLNGYHYASHPEKKDETLSNFIGQATYRYYGYERCRYYGYSHWSEDMIQEFGNRRFDGYSDTLLEGLARAYSAYSSKFSWHQFGGFEPADDSLKRRLGPLEMPSRRRIDSLSFYLSKSIEVYQQLAAVNNKYRLIVGNPQMKVVNEQVNAYMQLSFAGRDSLAIEYLNAVKPDPVLTAIARNYLNACAPNAILFTYSDNDSYPLWYMQHRENFRKDVAVINTSLLGLPVYMHMLRRNKTVAFSSQPDFYGDSSFVYFIRQDTIPGSIPLPQFIRHLQSRRTTMENEFYGTLLTYPYNTITLHADLERIKKLSPVTGLTATATIETGPYLLNSDFMILDIINSNMNIRPVYFTSREPRLRRQLIQAGPVFQFLPLNPEQETANERTAMRITKDYLLNQYFIVPSREVTTGVAASNTDDLAMKLFDDVAGYYFNQNRYDSVKYIYDQMLARFRDTLPSSAVLFSLAQKLLIAGYTSEGRQLMESYAQHICKLYRQPSALDIFITRSHLLATLAGLVENLAVSGVESEALNRLYEEVIATPSLGD